MNYLRKLKTAVLSPLRGGKGFDIRNIRPGMLVYLLAYVLELVFYCVRGHYIYVETRMFGLSGSTLGYAFHVVGSLVIMLLWKPRFRKLIYSSVFLFAAGFLPAIFVPEGTLKLILICFGMAGLGGVVSACRCGYAFVANNTERLVGMSVMIILVALIHRMDWSGIENVFTNQVLPIIVMAGLIFCLLRFKEGDFEVREETGPEDRKGLYWAFGFFTAYFAVDGLIYDLANTARETKAVFMAIGMIAAGLLLFTLIGVLKRNVQRVWNLFFVLLLLGAGLVAIRSYAELPRLQNLTLGLSVIGWPLAIYMLACALNRFASYRLLKQCTLIFALLSPLTSMMDYLVQDLLPEKLQLIGLGYAALFIVLYVLTLPYSTKHLFSQLWVDDMNEADMKKLAEEEKDPFDAYNLTPRQREVCEHLLSGKTYRQTAAEMGLSESTVKMHASELYKRLGIQSRVELFRMFGAK